MISILRRNTDKSTETVEDGSEVGAALDRTRGSTSSKPPSQVNWTLLNVILSGIVFVLVTCFELIIILQFSSFVDSTFGREMSGASSLIAIYCGIYIMLCAYQFGGAISANYENNSLEVVAVGIFNFVGTAYSGVQIAQMNKYKKCVQQFVQIVGSTVPNSQDQYRQINDMQQSCYFAPTAFNSTSNTYYQQGSKPFEVVANDINSNIDVFNIFPPLEYTILITMFFGSMAGVYCAYKCYQVHGWEVFSIQGADIQKRKIMQRYHAYLLFLKINAFFFAMNAVQYAAEVYFNEKYSASTPLNLALGLSAVFVSLCIYQTLGYFAMKKCNYVMAGIFLVLLFASFFVSVAILWKIFFDAPVVFKSSAVSIAAFACISIISIIVIYVFAVLLIIDFKQGLPEVIKNMEEKNVTRNDDVEASPRARFTVD